MSQLDTVFSQLFGQVTDSSAGWSNYGTDTGTVNNYVVALTPAPASYQVGFELTFTPINTNTGASVININALGTKSIVSAAGNALVSSQLIAGTATTLIYDGTQFRIISSSLPGILYGTDSGSANAYLVAAAPAPASYFTGLTVAFAPLNTNTGASTININSLGVKNITDVAGTAVTANWLLAGVAYLLIYDGTQFRVMNMPRFGFTVYSASQSVSASTLTTVNTWTVGPQQGPLSISYSSGTFTCNGLTLIGVNAVGSANTFNNPFSINGLTGNVLNTFSMWTNPPGLGGNTSSSGFSIGTRGSTFNVQLFETNSGSVSFNLYAITLPF